MSFLKTKKSLIEALLLSSHLVLKILQQKMPISLSRVAVIDLCEGENGKNVQNRPVLPVANSQSSLTRA